MKYMSELNILIKKAVSPTPQEEISSSSYTDIEEQIKTLVQQLIDLLVKKTPKNAEEDNILSLLQAYVKRQ